MNLRMFVDDELGGIPNEIVVVYFGSLSESFSGEIEDDHDDLSEQQRALLLPSIRFHGVVLRHIKFLRKEFSDVRVVFRRVTFLFQRCFLPDDGGIKHL
jgi:hypothetical protein